MDTWEPCNTYIFPLQCSLYTDVYSSLVFTKRGEDCGIRGPQMYIMHTDPLFSPRKGLFSTIYKVTIKWLVGCLSIALDICNATVVVFLLDLINFEQCK